MLKLSTLQDTTEVAQQHQVSLRVARHLEKCAPADAVEHMRFKHVVHGSYAALLSKLDTMAQAIDSGDTRRLDPAHFDHGFSSSAWELLGGGGQGNVYGGVLEGADGEEIDVAVKARTGCHVSRRRHNCVMQQGSASYVNATSCCIHNTVC